MGSEMCIRDSTQIFYVMLKPENSELRQRVSATEQCVCQPLLEDIITQGIEAGIPGTKRCACNRTDPADVVRWDGTHYQTGRGWPV